MTPTDMNLDLYECFKFGLPPPNTTWLNKLINKGLSNKYVQKVPLAFVRAKIVGLICAKKRKIKLD